MEKELASSWWQYVKSKDNVYWAVVGLKTWTGFCLLEQGEMRRSTLAYNINDDVAAYRNAYEDSDMTTDHEHKRFWVRLHGLSSKSIALCWEKEHWIA